MIKAVIFDCFGVLTTDTWLAFLDSLPEKADVETAHQLHRAYNTGLISKEEFQQQAQDATGQIPPQVEGMRAGDITKNLPLLEYIRELKNDFKIGLLSNIASPWITDSFLTAEEQQLFNVMVLSYEVGMTKPDPRIFILACQRLGVSPNEAVLVDDIDRYCDAARAEGLQAIQSTNLKQLKTELSTLIV